MPRIPSQKIRFASSKDFTQKVFAAFVRQGLTPRAAAILTAHTALSTGWGRSVHNYSLAGIKAGPREACYGSPHLATTSGSWFCSCSWEISKTTGKPVAGCPDCSPKAGKPRCKYPFRAYRSLDEGAAAILGILGSRRYARALSLLKSGSTDYFAEVGRAGWYTSDVSKTASLMHDHYLQVLKFLNMPLPTSGSWVILLGLAVGAGYLVSRYWK